MGEFLTVFGESGGEYTEKRSRFLAALRHCETEEEAAAFLSEIRALHRDARHNCYAYSVAGGTVKRFSDDGEPHGTAGKPILEVIEGAGLCDIAIVVTRYFGGVLLGTGGLVRAYTEAAKEAVSGADPVRMTSCTVFRTVCSYADVDRLMQLLRSNGCETENTEYAEQVTVTFHLESSLAERFQKALQETFSAKITAETVAEKMLPVKIATDLEEF